MGYGDIIDLRKKALSCVHFDTDFASCPNRHTEGIRGIIAFSGKIYNDSIKHLNVFETYEQANRVCAVCSEFKPWG